MLHKSIDFVLCMMYNPFCQLTKGRHDLRILKNFKNFEGDIYYD